MNIDELGLNVFAIATPPLSCPMARLSEQWLVNMDDVLYGSVITSREPNTKFCADNKLQTPTFVA